MNDSTQISPETEPVDLTNCDREPIHILGRVQSFGALVSVSSDWIVNHVSENIGQFLPFSHEDMIGLPLHEFISLRAIHDIRTRLQLAGMDDCVERLFALRLTQDEQLYDVAVHASGRSIIIEIERNAEDPLNSHASYVRPMIDRIGRSKSVEDLCHGAARQLRAMIGFDRVMVYKFAEDGTGNVIAESRRSDLEAFLGLRYPASDIPKQARALYLRSLLRIISDVNDEGAAILPNRNPEGAPLDLSLSTTRAVSPIHLEYLRNMGVGASMSISIVVRGRLWGLLACHNMSPKILPFTMRTAAELFGQLFSFLIDQKESDAERAHRQQGQEVHDRLMARLAEGSKVSENFEAVVDAMRSIISFDGVAGWIDGRYIAQGKVPTSEEFLGLIRFLNTTAAGKIYTTDSIASVYPRGEDFADRASGMLVLPVSRTPRDYIVLFRQAVARTVNWAGNPEKPVELGPNGMRLTPRKSFEAWQETVHGRSEPWQASEISAAEALRVTLLEVVLRMTDATTREQQRAQERQELLIAELNHRVRNILNLIRGIVSQSKSSAENVADFTEIVGGRIHALARAHDQITKENWNAASLRDLIKVEADAYLSEKSSRLLQTGPDVLIQPEAFATLSLVMHELITNSAKYGALSDQRGQIEIVYTLEADGALTIDWQEIGGPPIRKAPSRRGFGTTIIEKSIPFELKGSADIHFETTGLRAHFMVPPQYIHGVSETAAQPAAKEKAKPEHRSGSRLSGQVLLVEDNMIIAMDTEDYLVDLGAETVTTCANVRSAMQALESKEFSFAILDVNLGNETSEMVALSLVEAGTPFVFATGYGDDSGLSDRFSDVPVIQKPYSAEDIRSALEAMAKA